jgi:hypothetical protein
MLAPIEPEVGHPASGVRRGAAVASIAIVAPDRLRFELGRLSVGEELDARKLGWPLERCERRVTPDAFDISGRC